MEGIEECTIYALRLEQGKYYVGRTNRDVQERFAEHMSGRSGSAWTRRYKPLSIDMILERQSGFEEDKQVKIYMRNYGIANVRGGSYSSMELTSAQYDTLELEFRNAEDVCLACGSPGHFAVNCPSRQQRSPNTQQRQRCRGVTLQGTPCQSYLYLSSNGYCPAHQDQASSPVRPERSSLCPRCRRPGHGLSECYATVGANGYFLPAAVHEDEAVCFRCGRPGHRRADCFARTHAQGYSLASNGAVEDHVDAVCFRCGRPGHRRAECYARTHISGRFLDH